MFYNFFFIINIPTFLWVVIVTTESCLFVRSVNTVYQPCLHC